MKLLTHCLVLLLFFSNMALTQDKIVVLPGAKKIIGTEYAGYTHDANHCTLFYWFVASHNPASPLIIWTNGGPGYSSLYGFFNETGPYHITPALQLSPRQHAWNQFANYLIIDQPSGVGLSNTHQCKPVSDLNLGVHQYFHALQYFLKLHPQYKNSPIYLSGESYAGTYLPLLAMKILKYNQQAKQKINLKGLVLISPWADPIQQQSMDATYAFYHGLITQNQTIHLDKIYQQCKQLILAKQYLQANHICGKLDVQIKQFSKRHLCNIAYTQTQNNVLLDQYLRQPSVLKAIHATQSKPFKTWSESVNKNYDPIIQRSLLSVYNQLLKKHLPILIFSGLNDAKDTNYLGIEKFIQALKWDEKSSYLNAKRKNCGIGYSKMGGGLEWVTVFNAGHMVPQDQPKISGIVQKFTQPIVF